MAVHIDEPARLVELGVGDLLPEEEADPFGAPVGGWSRLIAGTRAHVDYARVRIADDPAYERERVVRGELSVDGYRVAILGRVDGIVRQASGIVVEELKSVVLSARAFRELEACSYPAYVLQLRIYLYLLGRAEEPELSGLPLRGRLVFVNLPEGDTRGFEVDFDSDQIERWIEARVRELLARFRSERQRLAARRARAQDFQFPFAARRPRQAEMEQACFQALETGECLLVSAPPGLGKTAGALSAALRHALARDRRVFFVTAKTTEQRVVAGTLGLLAAANPGLSAVVLRAKAKICLNDVVFCHAEVCEFARDYMPKVATGGSCERLLSLGLAEPEQVRAEGERVRACPFELSLELSERADVVVGDYNYVFDPIVALRREFDAAPSDDLVLIIDEAHNLLDRAREYYSPELESGPVVDLLATAQARSGAVYRALEAWLLSLLKLFAQFELQAQGQELLADPGGDAPSLEISRDAEALRARREALEPILLAYLMQRRESGNFAPDDPVLEIAYAFLRFARVMELPGDEFRYLLQRLPDGGTRLRILCLDPSRQLGRRLKAFHAVIAMSATLEPEAYFRDLLGFPADRTSTLVLGSAFAPENRRVLVVPTVSTVFRERPRYYAAVAAAIEDVYAAHPGHWLAFLPSFAYLREIEARLGRVPGELIVQGARTSDAERRAVLERLERSDGRPVLLLGVLGGVFAEGVDLPGEAVVGVIVVSPGLPQVSLGRELLRQRFEERFGRGFDYAYLVPGLNRVIQAAGRLLRSESDRGVVVLLDRRFADPAYTRFFPRDWYRDSPLELVTHDPAREVERFFAEP